ncbi:MAG: histidine kinase dimerization/phospho-acceptor domain-containing protein [Candidatus Omnitrophica bacterium]|nr:histidine kinase dimerization/phospho-acceptor domain-containing protein [Candidatus Omnitrophota bacterium]
MSKKKEYDILANSLLPRLMPGIIHEINNPLGVILNNNETLKGYAKEIVNGTDKKNKNNETSDHIKEDLPVILEEIEESALKISAIIRGLQILTAAEEEQRTVSINDLVDRVLDVCWNEFKYNFKVIKKYSVISKTRINTKETGLILLILFIDVVDVLKNSGEIEIYTGQKNNKLFVTIEDNRERKQQGKHPLFDKIACQTKKENEWNIEREKNKQKTRLLTAKTKKGQKTTLEIFTQ